MEMVPVVIVSKQQGVPIPSNDYTFTLSKEDFERFDTSEIDLRGAPLKDIFLVSVSQEDQLALSLLLSAEEKLDSTAVIGTFCQLQDIEEGPFEVKISCKVLARAKIDKYVQENGTVKAPLQVIRERLLPGEEELLNDLRVLVHHLIQNESTVSDGVREKISNTRDIIKISNILAGSLHMSEDDRYNYLQYNDNLDRFTLVLRYLVKLLDRTSMPATQQDVNEALPSGFISLFHELAMRAQQAQGQTKDDDVLNDIKIDELPEEVAKKIEKENKRLQNLPVQSMEYQTVQEYLDWILSIPWGKDSREPPVLEDFVDILNESHYGLEEVKDHLLEYMTIEEITKMAQGTVLCFSGPPGTGKTSVAKQIAKATNRRIVKIALGGMSDEAELRGHRRTYVAARPGRIITGLTRTGVMDPLFLLDEVDKTSSHKGDPASALLELLDPEQNSEYIDRFVELPVDLSKAMFICTANDIDDIPPALKDRLEIVEFREYEDIEKITIARDYILPKAIKDYQLEDFEINFEPDSFSEICNRKGVRDIERNIKKLLRRAAVSIRVNKEQKVSIDKTYVKETFKKKIESGIGFK